jgi:NADPH:quinone reductase-like Zn-dependent oxidoreductase
MRCVAFSGVGGREVVSIQERPDPQPGRFELVIAPAFAGLNAADVLQREGIATGARVVASKFLLAVQGDSTAAAVRDQACAAGDRESGEG